MGMLQGIEAALGSGTIPIYHNNMSQLVGYVRTGLNSVIAEIGQLRDTAQKYEQKAKDDDASMKAELITNINEIEGSIGTVGGKMQGVEQTIQDMKNEVNNALTGIGQMQIDMKAAVDKHKMDMQAAGVAM